MKARAEGGEDDRHARFESGLLLPFGGGDQHRGRRRIAVAADVRVELPGRYAQRVGDPVDQVLIGQMLNDKQVGLYSAAARIAEIWYFIPIGIAGSTFPLLVESKKQSED